MPYGAILLPFKNPLFINSILDKFTLSKIANKHKVFILYIQTINLARIKSKLINYLHPQKPAVNSLNNFFIDKPSKLNLHQWSRLTLNLHQQPCLTFIF